MKGLHDTICETGRRLLAAGLVHGSAGNISVRHGDHVSITPSGIDYVGLEAADIVTIDLAGAVVDGSRAPSSERAVHLEIYRGRPDVSAIVHTHSISATALAAIGEPIPAFLVEAMVVLGGVVAVAPFRMTGTPELGVAAARALGSGRAVLLQSHGAVAVGSSLDEARDRAFALEEVAKVYVHVLSMGREPLPLT